MVPKKMHAAKPKRKQAPDASSDEHTYADKYFHFIDDAAMKAHKERFANREVLTRRKVAFHSLGAIGSFFQEQMLVPYLSSISDTKYYPHLVLEFYANLGISEYICESFLLGIELPFDETLIVQLLKIPSTGLDITLNFEELGWSYQEINKTISSNKRSTIKPNKLNQLTKQSRIIAYIVATNIIQKEGHNDELSELSRKAVYAITKKIPVNWPRVMIHCMKLVKTKVFYGPSLTDLFEHYSVPLEDEPSLTVKSKPIDSVVIDKMEQALERVKRLKNIKTSKASTSGAQEREEESLEEEDEDQVNK